MRTETKGKRKDFKVWLIEKDLTYQTFADKVGVSCQTVASWVRGAYEPSPLAVVALRGKYPDCPILKEAAPKKKLAVTRR